MPPRPNARLRCRRRHGHGSVRQAVRAINQRRDFQGVQERIHRRHLIDGLGDCLRLRNPVRIFPNMIRRGTRQVRQERRQFAHAGIVQVGEPIQLVRAAVERRIHRNRSTVCLQLPLATEAAAVVRAPSRHGGHPARPQARLDRRRRSLDRTRRADIAPPRLRRHLYGLHVRIHRRCLVERLHFVLAPIAQKSRYVAQRTTMQKAPRTPKSAWGLKKGKPANGGSGSSQEYVRTLS